MSDDRTYYNPRFFVKESSKGPDGKKIYKYKSDGNKYWEERDKGKWEDSPLIFQDSCEPFY